MCPDAGGRTPTPKVEHLNSFEKNKYKHKRQERELESFVCLVMLYPGHSFPAMASG